MNINNYQINNNITEQNIKYNTDRNIEDNIDDNILNHINIKKNLCLKIEELLLNCDGKIINILKNNNLINDYFIIECILSLTENINLDIIKNLVNLYLDNFSNNLKYELIKKSEEIYYFKFFIDNTKILKLYIYDIDYHYYFHNFTEASFDINTIYKNYKGFHTFINIFSNRTIYINDIQNRILKKKFSSISTDLPLNIQQNGQLKITKFNYFFYSKLIYAIDLIENNWIMDEYNEKYNLLSWTVNYWKNYKNKLNYIKFNNDSSIDNNCFFCDKTFNDMDIIFNYKNYVFHTDCLKHAFFF